ncbi:MAG: phage portal protein, partial [Oscillospiraceae bacterium]|nr:phage portal protein [Oscillospiraceae bacterium]
ECLGPVLQMFQQRINSFLLPMLGADPDTYVEFDLQEKIKGNFEERASILQSATGGPWMTRNEARADNNLPPIEGGDELIVPLNVLEGGQASPTDTHMEPQDGSKSCGCASCRSKAEPIRIKGRSEKEEDEKLAAVISKFLKRQSGSVLPKLGAKAARWWDADRWDAELADDIEPLMDEIADAHGKGAAGQIGTEYSTAVTRNYLKAMAAGRAKAINAATYKKLLQAVEDAEAEEEEVTTPAEVFEKREDVDAQTLGRSLATAVASWAVIEAVHQARRDGYRKAVEKVWVTGDNPRPSHQMMDGETVPIDQNFSNGAYWPGDDNLDPDESCGCNCSTEIIVTEG